ncbi:MAG TPA: outer membrane lipoprotein-sorting protein [Candidatus Binatia bacterium]|nr:outer membrane lipoprotein-sorting protein [Candidatus Binatia bacterium]
MHPRPAFAADDARDLIEQARRLNDGARAWKDRQQTLALEIFDGRGGTRRRELVMKTLRGHGGEDKTITVFREPSEVRGTSFLQFAHKDRDAEQWLYLPELKRVRQITSRAKDQSFMGTDFSYRDLELLTDVLEWTADEARATSKGNDTIDGDEAALIELVPLKKDVGYSRIVIALSRRDLVIRRMEFYRDADAPKKVLRLDRIEPAGVVPTARRLEMVQPDAGTRTVVDVSDVRYDQGLAEDLFTQRALERAGEDAG